MVAMKMGGSLVGGWRKGPWTHEEDKLLTEYVTFHGDARWSSVSNFTGLNRSGKSCRLRWVNYLRPGLKKGQLTPLEEGIIIELHALFGNKWSTIAKYLPGRTDNEIKNYWRTHFKNNNNKKKKLEKKKARMMKQELQVVEEEQPITTNNETKENNNHGQQDYMYPTLLEHQQQEQYFLSSNNSWLDHNYNTTVPDYDDDDASMWFSLWDFENGGDQLIG